MNPLGTLNRIIHLPAKLLTSRQNHPVSPNATTMCCKTECGTCMKPTWSGCGMHIDTALAGVPLEERCECKARTQAEAAAKKK